MEEKDRYAVLGHPVSHSLSPVIHRLFAEETGQRLDYRAVDIEPHAFERTLAAWTRDRELAGANVTLPFKSCALAVADEVTTTARLAGAVNTLSWRDGRLLGANTDGEGFASDLDALGVAVAGARVLLVGAGGAARGILAPLLAAAPASLVLANRTPSRAADLLETMESPARTRAVSLDMLGGLGAFDLVVNASALGHGQGCTGLKWPASLAAEHAVAYDLSYGDAATAFVDWARTAGFANIHDGLGMLVRQAAASFRIWRGVEPNVEPVLGALRNRLPVL